MSACLERLSAGALVWACLAVAPGGLQAQEVRIVGIGAATCARYLSDIEVRAQAERDYLAWAQGFMSGLVVRAPPGRDEDLDLAPPTFPLRRQAAFLRAWCEANPRGDFSDGVGELYRSLRSPSS